MGPFTSPAPLPEFKVRICQPDLSPWVAGNTGIAGVTTLQSESPGLHVALHVHCGRWRIDPPGGHKGEGEKQPKHYGAEGEPTNDGLEATLRKRGSEGWILIGRHIPV